MNYFILRPNYFVSTWNRRSKHLKNNVFDSMCLRFCDAVTLPRMFYGHCISELDWLVATNLSKSWFQVVHSGIQFCFWITVFSSLTLAVFCWCIVKKSHNKFDDNSFATSSNRIVCLHTLGSRTSQVSSQRGYGEIKIFWGAFWKQLMMQCWW